MLNVHFSARVFFSSSFSPHFHLYLLSFGVEFQAFTSIKAKIHAFNQPFFFVLYLFCLPIYSMPQYAGFFSVILLDLRANVYYNQSHFQMYACVSRARAHSLTRFVSLNFMPDSQIRSYKIYQHVHIKIAWVCICHHAEARDNSLAST